MSRLTQFLPYNMTTTMCSVLITEFRRQQSFLPSTPHLKPELLHSQTMRLDQPQDISTRSVYILTISAWTKMVGTMRKEGRSELMRLGKRYCHALAPWLSMCRMVLFH